MSSTQDYYFPQMGPMAYKTSNLPLRYWVFDNLLQNCSKLYKLFIRSCGKIVRKLVSPLRKYFVADIRMWDRLEPTSLY